MAEFDTVIRGGTPASDTMRADPVVRAGKVVADAMSKAWRRGACSTGVLMEVRRSSAVAKDG